MAPAAAVVQAWAERPVGVKLSAPSRHPRFPNPARAPLCGAARWRSPPAQEPTGRQRLYLDSTRRHCEQRRNLTQGVSKIPSSIGKSERRRTKDERMTKSESLRRRRGTIFSHSSFGFLSSFVPAQRDHSPFVREPDPHTRLPTSRLTPILSLSAIQIRRP